MKETWYFIAAEFRALCLRCVAHGPEFWLAVTAMSGAICFALIVGYLMFKEEDK